jgi:hypothetical protein
MRPDQTLDDEAVQETPDQLHVVGAATIVT